VTGTNDMGGTVKNIQNAIADIEENLPPGYYLDFGGAYEDMQEAFVTLGLGTSTGNYSGLQCNGISI